MSDDSPFFITGSEQKGPWLITCDHARNHVPAAINGGSLGLSVCEMQRHIAYDVGAEGLSLALGKYLQSPVLCSNFSRLVIDPNRGEDDPTLLMKVYDGTLIPANRNTDAADVERRLEAYHRPYHKAYSELATSDRAIVAVHSFTPRLKGRSDRPWEIGILFAKDRRLADLTIARLQARGNLTVGINEPYDGHLPGDSIDQHALPRDLLNILIEVRNDLIGTKKEQNAWARLLAPILQQALAATDTSKAGE
jgi:predicted N-formylglutamate amidohydrolase